MKEIAKGKSAGEVTKKIGRHAKTIRKYLQNHKYRNMHISSDVNWKFLDILTSQALLEDDGIQDVSKTTRNKIFGTFARQKTTYTQAYVDSKIQRRSGRIREDRTSGLSEV